MQQLLQLRRFKPRQAVLFCELEAKRFWRLKEGESNTIWATTKEKDHSEKFWQFWVKEEFPFPSQHIFLFPFFSLLLLIIDLLHIITKTRPFKYIENFTSRNWKISDKKNWYFSYFCSKHRLWVLDRTASPLVRTASARRFYRVPTIYVLSRNMKNNAYPCKPQFYYIKLGFKGVKII